MSALFSALLESESKESLAAMVCELREEKADLLGALKEMLAAFSMENIGVNASLRRTRAKRRAREAITKATGD